MTRSGEMRAVDTRDAEIAIVTEKLDALRAKLDASLDAARAIFEARRPLHEEYERLVALRVELESRREAREAGR